MHIILTRTLGISHTCDDSTHDWCAFLTDCTTDVEYNNRDKYRIVISLMYTKNSPEMGTKLLDVMEEQITILHKCKSFMMTHILKPQSIALVCFRT